MQDIYYEQIQYSEPGINGDFAMIVCYDLMGIKSETVPHWHKALEVTLPLENSLLVTEDGNLREVPEGKVLCINSRTVHITKGKDKTRYSRGIVVVLSEELLLSLCPDFEQLRFSLPPDSPAQPELAAVMEELYRCKMHPTPYIQGRINSLLYQLCYLLLSHCAVLRDGGESPQDQRPDFLARQAVEYIDLNFKSSLTLSQVAARVGLQENYFCRYFRKYIGMSFGKYLSQVRLKFALAYMTEFGASVVESALQAGFASAKSFTDCCRRVYGMTPSEYKRALDQHEQPGLAGAPVMRPSDGREGAGN